MEKKGYKEEKTMKILKKTLVVLMISLFVLALAQPAVLGYNWGSQINTMAGKSGNADVTGAFTNISGAVITIARKKDISFFIKVLLRIDFLSYYYQKNFLSNRISLKVINQT